MLISDFKSNDLDYLRLIEATCMVRVEANVNNSEITSYYSLLFMYQKLFLKMRICILHMERDKTKSEISGVGTRNLEGLGN